MGLNERFLENEQNISALKIHRTGISVLLLICMWISLLDCGTVRIMDVKMAAYEMKAMPSAVEAEKGILTAGRCYPAWEKMKDSMVTDKKILPAVSQTLETAEAGIEKNVTEKSDSRLTKTVTYVSRDGVLFSEQETCLFAFPAGRTGIYPIPENVVRLAKDAFSESRLFKVIGMKERGMEQTDLPDTLVVE